jgi:hypothetical protein
MQSTDIRQIKAAGIKPSSECARELSDGARGCQKAGERGSSWH